MEKTGSVAVVLLPGETLDANNSKEFRASIDPVLDENDKVLFDMSDMRFVDSSGCGALLSCLRTLNARGGDLKLCNVSKPVRVLFELIRMHRIVDIFNSKDEAIRAFGE